MNDGIFDDIFNGLSMDENGVLYYGNNVLKYNTYANTYAYADRHDTSGKTKLKSPFDNLNPETEEDIKIVVEYLRIRLEKVLNNPDLVYKLSILDKLDKMDLIEKTVDLEKTVKHLKDRVSNLENMLTELRDLIKDLNK